MTKLEATFGKINDTFWYLLCLLITRGFFSLLRLNNSIKATSIWYERERLCEAYLRQDNPRKDPVNISHFNGF